MSPSGRELMLDRARELARPREAPAAAGVVLLPFHAGGLSWAVMAASVWATKLSWISWSRSRGKAARAWQ